MTMAWIAVGILLAAAGAVQVLVMRVESRHPPAGVLVPVDGGRLHVVEPPSTAPAGAPAVVLIHGASGNSGDMLLALAGPLGSRYRVLAVDRPGHGWSDRPGGRADSDPARQAALIRQAVGALGVGQAVVVAHSLAGVVATRLALDHPDFVAGLVLVSPVTHPWPGGVAWYYDVAATPVIGPLFSHTIAPLAGLALMDGGVRGSFHPDPTPDGYAEATATPLVLRPRQFEANAQDVAGLLAHVEAQHRAYGRIRIPTAVVHGQADGVTSAEIHSRAIAEQIEGARLLLLPGGGHMPHHSHPELVAGLVDDVVARGRRMASAP